MKHTATTTADTLADQVIREAMAEVAACEAALRKGCGHALRAGLRLLWLHGQTAQEPNGSRVSRDTRLGFDQACEQIGLARRTAYRWMNACGHALLREGMLEEGEDLMGELPAPGTARWEIWDAALEKAAAGTSLNRLILGASREGSETHRLSELTDAVEEGRTRAIELMEAVENGRYTLAQAVKALGSQEAYDRLRDEGGEKVRKDPVYLDVDPKTGALIGLVPKSLTTIKNAFLKWETLPEGSRRKVRDLWLDVVTQMPRELLER